MTTSKKQQIEITAIAVIVLIGLFGGAAVLLSKPHASGEAPHVEESKSVGDAHEEGFIRMSEEQAKAAGITLQVVGAGQLQTTADFAGEVRLNEDRTTHVVPRLVGAAEAVPVDLGQQVQKGQVLTVIASTALSNHRSELLTAQRRRDAARLGYEREKKLWEDRISAQQDYQQAQAALQEADIAVQNAAQKLAAVGATAASTGLNRFEVRAPFAGTVVEKHLSLGEAVKEDARIFTVSDLSSVWAEFAVAPQDLARVRVGQRVVLSSSAFDSKAEGTISYVGALLGEQTRTARARVTLGNPGGIWRPGLFVTVAVLGEDQDAAMTLSADALQTIDSKTVVFKAASAGFVMAPIKIGRSDGKTVEVLEGLKPGDKVAATQTFVLKAELGKGSAEHAH